MILDERHLHLVNLERQLHDNRERPHKARGHLQPGTDTPPKVNETARLGGLLKH